ncbi:MAG: UDP-3-O-(3-hydroxymyristoyl)glucosamine N-acyltransferase [Acidobacteria bacterium]|nr:UDP-3-O-(3-hydroxymyristoyl)glucosamine N-acyltransferase [Acidobacteriota bacterium]
MRTTVGEIAAYVGGEVVGDPKTEVTGFASLERAGPGDLVYVEGEKHAELGRASAASAVFVARDVSVPGKVMIRVANPKLAFARAVEWLAPEPRMAPGIHPTALVAPSAQLGQNVAVGPYVVIEAHARIANDCQIGAGCYVGERAELGEGCVLFPRVTLCGNVRLGAQVRIHSGTVVGSDGFGYVFAEGSYHKFPQRGRVEIGDDVEIGANSAIDRGALDATVIGRGTKLDNLVHVAHNVRIGEHCVLAAQTGVSGSSTLGNYVVAGGQVGIADHVRIEDRAVLGAQAGIPTGKRILREHTVWGTPARPLEEFKKAYAYFARLPELAARLEALEKKPRRRRKRA